MERFRSNLLFVLKFGSKKFHFESKAPPRHQQSSQDRHLFPDPPRHPTVGQDMTRITFKTKFRTEPFNGAVNPIIGQPVRCDRVGPRIAPVRVRPSLAVQRMDPNFKTNNKFAIKALPSKRKCSPVYQTESYQTRQDRNMGCLES